MNRSVRRIAMALLWMTAGPLLAQDNMRGHWTGTLETPGGPLAMEVDLDQGTGGWIGSFSVPAQGTKGMPLETVAFTDGKGSFHLKGIPGDPNFTGVLSKDGKTLDGNFSQGGMSLPIKLTRTGDPKVELPKVSPAVGPEFLGAWEGTIPAGPGLRVVLTVSNAKTGAEALLVSVDQGNVQIPVSAITQKGTKLTLEVNLVGGSYSGDINKEGTELNGTWTQAGMDLPLQFKKAAKTP